MSAHTRANHHTAPAVIHRGGKPGRDVGPAPYRRGMRLHLTVAYRAGAPPWSTDGDTGGVHEVEVQAPEGCTTRELVRALSPPEDPHADRVLAVSGTVVDDEAV